MAILSGVHAEYDPELLDTSLPAHAALQPQLRTTEPARAALFRSLLRRLGLKTVDVVREPPPVTHLALVTGGFAPTHPYSTEIASLFSEAVVGAPALDTGDASGQSVLTAPTTGAAQQPFPILTFRSFSRAFAPFPSFVLSPTVAHSQLR